jgi:hypothetical protein
MKIVKLLPLLFVFLLASCSSIRVTADYDTKADFNSYKTFAFYKKGIDKAEISDLDKKRILKAIESEMLAKGFTKSEDPDLLVNIFTKARQRVDIHQNPYHYWGWNPWYYRYYRGSRITKYTEGTLFVDLIDANKKELAWQGIGSGALHTSGDMAKKEEKIKHFVTEIMAKYPPGAEK